VPQDAGVKNNKGVQATPQEESAGMMKV